jgi:hypothetical protein
MSQTDKAAASKEFTSWLDTMSKFHHYSAGNIFMIFIQKPDATHVAGFHKWLELHRYVRKGEHGIQILCPCLRHTKDQDGTEDQLFLSGFRVGYVFDISQTEGEPLIEIHWHENGCDEYLQKQLISLAKHNNIVIEYTKLPGTAQGSSLGGKIKLVQGASNATLIHELSHEILHQVKDEHYTKKQSELEAESVSYVVCKYFHLEHTAAAIYITMYGATSKDILQSMQRIQRTANQIITSVETETAVEEQ